jgi:hypothetical protein
MSHLYIMYCCCCCNRNEFVDIDIDSQYIRVRTFVPHQVSRNSHYELHVYPKLPHISIFHVGVCLLWSWHVKHFRAILPFRLLWKTHLLGYSFHVVFMRNLLKLEKDQNEFIRNALEFIESFAWLEICLSKIWFSSVCLKVRQKYDEDY